MMRNAKNSGMEVKKITAKSEKQYQENRQRFRNELLGTMRVNGGLARRLRTQRRVMERGRPEVKRSLSF